MGYTRAITSTVDSRRQRYSQTQAQAQLCPLLRDKGQRATRIRRLAVVIERTVQPHELGRRPWRRLTHGLHGLRGLDVLHLLHGRWLLLLLWGRWGVHLYSWGWHWHRDGRRLRHPARGRGHQVRRGRRGLQLLRDG